MQKQETKIHFFPRTEFEQLFFKAAQLHSKVHQEFQVPKMEGFQITLFLATFGGGKLSP